MSGSRDIPNALAERQGLVEAALREQMARASEGGLPLYRMMQYQLGWVDRDGSELLTPAPDRLSGTLCVESAATVSKDAADRSAQTATACVGAQLLEESVNVHEQMQTGEGGAGDHPAIWWVWGPAQAINVGDGLHALARLAVFRMRDHGVSPEQTLAAVELLDDAALHYYEGQYLELTYQERLDITEAQYSTMARAKKGSLMSGSIAVGALAAGADEATIDTMKRAGKLLGEAAQIRADVESIWGTAAGESGRILNKSKLYPVVHALERGTLSQKRELGAIYFKRVMEPRDVDGLRIVLDGLDVRSRSEERATELGAEALNLIEQVSVAPGAATRWAEIVTGLAGR
jgi:geranylgeranyl diphosphate synthase type I